MTSFEIIMTILNLLAIVIIPIAAVIIGQWLQNRAAKRRDKLEVFKTLMANRDGWTVESVQALNILDIVFADNENVRTAWKEFYNSLCIQNPNEMECKQCNQAHKKLLIAMAASLGYRDKISWETIENMYKPVGMVQAMNQQQMYQNGQMQLLGLLLKKVQDTSPQNQSNQEDNPNAHT